MGNYVGDISDLAFQTSNVTSAFSESNFSRLKFVNAGSNPSKSLGVDSNEPAQHPTC